MAMDPLSSCYCLAVGLSSSVMFQQMSHLGMGIVFYMVIHFDCNICKFIVILLALSDGIMNNDAMKHNGSETKNETWTKLLQDLKFFEGEDDHIMYLRRRFVLGASESMSGCNGSNQNDKALFGYTDEEWAFIWMTMIEDGAWAVPSIKNKEGNTIKANWAPEILIKFIAHELKCHIIVFDLLLNTVQFLSGNHVKSENVVFDSPLLLYTTGGHFQSVLPMDHEFFINYAKELEAENNPRDTDIRKSKVYPKTGTEKADQNDKQSSSSSNVYSKDTTPGGKN